MRYSLIFLIVARVSAQIYQYDNLLTTVECSQIITDAENYGKKHGWTSKRHQKYPTVDLPLQNLKYYNRFEEIVSPALLTYIQEKFQDYREFEIYDPFVVKYETTGMRQLQPHRDGSVYSFIITLNRDFTGGGTYFLNDKYLAKDLPIGTAIVFRGMDRHRGLPILSGRRFILVGFMRLAQFDPWKAYGRG